VTVVLSFAALVHSFCMLHQVIRVQHSGDRQVSAAGASTPRGLHHGLHTLCTVMFWGSMERSTASFTQHTTSQQRGATINRPDHYPLWVSPSFRLTGNSCRKVSHDTSRAPRDEGPRDANLCLQNSKPSSTGLPLPPLWGGGGGGTTPAMRRWEARLAAKGRRG
jgi:hypothetical protein